ncbi:hypothetical protein AURANDRAFT_67519 [Aureococcus anophagefferens]|uniref:Uncharacterized protein n=1 Tax=Aureococcus anophagefferens TaxID=44056 RepID=F0YLF1_AURAN|nr:hypothetical protein AURANDRAFT_67519 [Aureococcus anophagefferens]EGB04087.1 hypothetical protein AURANDRAFT_67519 [Aureococcus anophagefferens]|eukprot:XP_009041212.1 hypothetical protein AURANDRAFT_67519 [Aureococcus anophagefferens]
MGAVVTDEPRLVENDVHVCVAKARARDKSLTYSEALAYYESLGQLKSSDIRGCNLHKRNRGCMSYRCRTAKILHQRISRPKPNDLYAKIDVCAPENVHKKGECGEPAIAEVLLRVTLLVDLENKTEAHFTCDEFFLPGLGAATSAILLQHNEESNFPFF